MTAAARRGFAVTAALALAGAALLAPRDLEGARTAVRNYTTSEGLPQSQVTALCQDRMGVMWIGTQAGGIGRYDGQRWESFDVASGLPSGSVTGIVIGADGRPVAGTSGGLARWDGQTWKAVSLPGDPVRSIVRGLFADPAGPIFVGTETGLYDFPPNGGSPRAVPGAPAVTGGAPTCFAADGGGGIWVGTEKGLARIRDAKNPSLEPVGGLPPGPIGALLAREAGVVWVGVSGAGLFAGGLGGFRRIGDDAVPGRHVQTLAAETAGDGAVWIGTLESGAFRHSGDAFESFGTPKGLLNSTVYAILEDREGVLWFGTEGGLTKRGPSAFLTYAEEDGFPAGESVYGMAETSDRALWFAAGRGGVVRLGSDGVVRRWGRAQGMPDEQTLDVAADRNDTVWVSTRSALFRIRRGKLEPMKWSTAAENRVRTLVTLPDGRLLLGTRGAGVLVLTEAGVENLAGPIGPNVSTILLAPDGTIWCGGDGWGVVGLAQGKPPVVLTQKTGLPSNQVSGLFVDSRGTLWVSTAGGAFAREASGRTFVVDRRSGLPESFVYWVGEDRDHGLWFGTNRGAARLDAGGTLDLYTGRDGLGADECNEDGFFVDSAGRVWVSTIGVSRFLGRPRARRSIPPEVFVQNVSVGGHDTPAFAGSRLPSDPGPITIRFAAPTFTDENAVRFRYRLLGLSDAWSDGGPGQSETTFGGLGPGRYVFEVGARTGDGRAARANARVAFSVRPVWWKTWTALGALGAVLLLFALGVIRLRERRLVATSASLERKVAERTEELRRANERLAMLAITDDLTGLANRRRILERLNEAIALCRRQGMPLALAMADLDRFKEINDTYGHAEGDRLLTQTAQALQRALRTEDLLGRYGGEEFLAVLPGSDSSGAIAAGDRLRRAMEEVALPAAAGGGILRTTISVGVASLDPGVATPSELIRRADEALYRAKAAGRNRVEVF